MTLDSRQRVPTAHTLREVLREADKQGLVNMVIHWSPHTESRILPAPAPALSVWTSIYHRVQQTLPASFSQNCSQYVGTQR